jgi:hypothetical protein
MGARIRRALPILLGLLILSACQTTSSNSAATMLPQAQTARIHSPQNGVVIYAETIPIIGTGQGESFTVQLVDIEDAVIAQAEATVSAGGEWGVDLVHGYHGEPSEMLVQVLDSSGALLDVSTIIVADVSHRPEGVYGWITWPVADAAVGGDVIFVEGMASGVDTFTVTLTLPGGTLVDSKTVTTYNPNRIDEMPWSVELATQGLLGEAVIDAYFTPIDDHNPSIQRVPVVITMEAG